MINSLIKALLDPPLLIFYALILIWILSLTPWRRVVRRLLFLCIVFLGLVKYGPLPALLSQPLAERFPAFDPQTTPAPELIVVLGGMTKAEPVFEPGAAHPSFTGRSERFLMGVELAKLHPGAKLAFTGWAGAEAGIAGAEATRLATLARTLGVPAAQIIEEPFAQTTGQHPQHLENLVSIGPDPAYNVYLVTSAVHIPRAMGVFRAAGWSNLTAVPVDYPFPPGTSMFSIQNPAGTETTIVRDALNEWAGLFSYYFSGQTTNLLPAP